MYDIVDIVRGRKTTPNSTELRPNSTTLPSRIEPNNSAEVLQNRTSAHLYFPHCSRDVCTNTFFTNSFFRLWEFPTFKFHI